MLRPRITPCLLIHKGGLVKTIGFDSPKYVGDPLNAVRIFNEKQVDELLVIDIDATRLGKEPDYALVKNLAAECRMPLAYGGGVKSAEQLQRIIGLGVEKVAISSSAIADPDLIRSGADRVGSQSIAVVLDCRSEAPGVWKLSTHNGQRATGIDAVEFAVLAERMGAGEVILNSIDRDGSMVGYDLGLVSAVRAAINLPITALGGAGSHADIGVIFSKFGTIGAAAGSLFVFKGKYRAVLINYPTFEEKENLAKLAEIDP